MEEAGMNEQMKKVSAHHDWWSETYDSDYYEHFALYHKITLGNSSVFSQTIKVQPYSMPEVEPEFGVLG